jgi:hypothetical protein
MNEITERQIYITDHDHKRASFVRQVLEEENHRPNHRTGSRQTSR